MNPPKIFLMCNWSAWVGSGVKTHTRKKHTYRYKPFRLRLRCVKLFVWLVGRYLKIPSTLSFLQEAYSFHDTVFMLQDGWRFSWRYVKVTFTDHYVLFNTGEIFVVSVEPWKKTRLFRAFVQGFLLFELPQGDSHVWSRRYMFPTWMFGIYPIPSMYGILPAFGWFCLVNVCKCTIHGCYGYLLC